MNAFTEKYVLVKFLIDITIRSIFSKMIIRAEYHGCLIHYNVILISDRFGEDNQSSINSG